MSNNGVEAPPRRRRHTRRKSAYSSPLSLLPSYFGTVAFVRLILKNALRNRRRTLLTTLSVAVSLFLLVSLRTLITEMKGDTLMTVQSGPRPLTRPRRGAPG